MVLDQKFPRPKKPHVHAAVTGFDAETLWACFHVNEHRNPPLAVATPHPTAGWLVHTLFSLLSADGCSPERLQETALLIMKSLWYFPWKDFLEVQLLDPEPQGPWAPHSLSFL